MQGVLRGAIIRDSVGHYLLALGRVADWFGGRVAKTEDAMARFYHHGPAQIPLELNEIERSNRRLPWAVRGPSKRR